VFDEIDSHKSAITSLTLFQKTIQAVAVVEPRKASFNFPPLPTVPYLVFIFWWASSWNRHVILAIRGIRYDATFAQCLSEWFTIVAFIEPQAFRSPPPFTDFNTVYRFKDFTLIVPVGLAQREAERMTVGINDQVTFYAANTVFS